MPNESLWLRIEAAVEQFGTNLPTRTKSRRHGFQPKARQHVEDYLSNRVLGLSLRTIAKASGRAPSTVAVSIKRGEQLVKGRAELEGFRDPCPSPGRDHAQVDEDEDDEI